ncbi:MAG: CBS domain-containing protein [Myxococcales bacterium]|nr:CBS domain-containing protein [Myxococcales bacterium]
MTYPVRVVRPTDTLSFARELMQTYHIRHLPVVENECLRGVVVIADLYTAETVVEVNTDKTLVDQLMVTEHLTVEPTMLLVDVVEAMAERHLGFALVATDNRLEGIFTTTDACRTLALMLR